MASFSSIFHLSVATAALLASSCTPAGNAGFVRRTTSAANDHIMFVQEQPQTFGHKRLTAMSGIYPDLQIFLTQQGFPDFLAETNKSGNRYLILYYLGVRKAFACRSGAGKSHQVEFSGPYPVTDREFATLDGIRKKALSVSIETRKNFACISN